MIPIWGQHDSRTGSTSKMYYYGLDRGLRNHSSPWGIGSPRRNLACLSQISPWEALKNGTLEWQLCHYHLVALNQGIYRDTKQYAQLVWNGLKEAMPIFSSQRSSPWILPLDCRLAGKSDKSTMCGGTSPPRTSMVTAGHQQNLPAREMVDCENISLIPFPAIHTDSILQFPLFGPSLWCPDTRPQ